MTSRLSFLFESRYTGETLEKVWETIKSGVSEGLSAKGIIDTLREMGGAYRRQDMLSDIRRMGSVAKISMEAGITAERAMSFYDSVIEPYRKSAGLTGKQAWENYHKWERLAAETEEELAELEEAAEEYGWYRSERGASSVSA